MTDSPENALDSAAQPGPAVWKPALKEAAWAFLAAAILLVIVYAFAFKHLHPEFVRFMGQDAKPLTATGKDFIPVSVGKGRKEGSQFIIEDFNGDEAILALPRAFRAEDYPFIKVNLSGFTRYSKAKILWQQSGDPTTHALELNRSGDEVTQIAMVYGGEAYAGAIDSIALLFYDGPALGFENNNDVDIVIDSIEFRPFSAERVAEQVFEDWTNPPLWQGYSNNIVRGIHHNGLLPPNLVVCLLVGASILLVAVHRATGIGRSNGDTSNHSIITTMLFLCFCGWIFNEVLRWHWRAEQMTDSIERYAGQPLEQKIRRAPIRCARFPDGCRADLLPYF